jgi:branched-chain amino acid transport system permease protein
VSLMSVGQALAGGLASGTHYAFLALPFAILLGLARVLNLAHGELVILGGYVAYAAGRAWGVPVAVLPAVAALAVAPLGLAWRALAARVREPVELNSLALTFGLALLLQTGTTAVWSADYRLIPARAAGPVLLGLSPERAALAVVGLAVFLALHLGLTRTRWGVAVRATSRDAEAAALMGIDTGRIARVAFATAGGLAGAGGALFATLHYLHPAAGVELTLLAVTVAILGGVGRLQGLLVAGLAVGLVEALALAWIGVWVRELAVMVLLLAALLWRGRGLQGGGLRD